jgi:hypothetical protein
MHRALNILGPMQPSMGPFFSRAGHVQLELSADQVL